MVVYCSEGGGNGCCEGEGDGGGGDDNGGGNGGGDGGGIFALGKQTLCQRDSFLFGYLQSFAF